MMDRLAVHAAAVVAHRDHHQVGGRQRLAPIEGHRVEAPRRDCGRIGVAGQHSDDAMTGAASGEAEGEAGPSRADEGEIHGCSSPQGVPDGGECRGMAIAQFAIRNS